MACVGIWSRNWLSSKGFVLNLYLGNPVGISGLSEDKSIFGGMMSNGSWRVEGVQEMG